MDKYCGECGNKINQGEKFCGSCGKAVNSMQPKQNNNNKMPIGVKIILITFGVILIGSIINSSFEDDSKEYSNSTTKGVQTTQSTTTTVITKSNEELKQEEKEYKDSCKTYSYKEIFRHPENYRGKHAKVKGEVIQVMDLGNTLYQLRVNVTKGEYGIYQDTMFITLEKDKFDGRIIEDDIITFWGEFGDLYTYKSVLNAEITIPSLQGKYAELSK